MQKDKLELVKKEIRSVIITYPKGVSVQNFLKAYRQLVGVRLPTREFGFFTDIDFLHSIPDVVRIQIDKNGDYLLNCIADETTEHIKNLVVKQKISKPKTQKNDKFVKNLNSSFYTKPFVSAALRQNLFQVLKDFPDGLNYHSLLLAYRKKFRKNLNLDFLSDNNHEKLEMLAAVVTELEVKIIDDVTRLFYRPLIKQKGVTQNGKINHVDNVNFNKNTLCKQNLNEMKDSEISGIPQIIREDFEKVMKLYPDGILARDFPMFYEKLTGEYFDILGLGYSSLIELAIDLPDIFICVKSYENPSDWILFHPGFSDNAKNLKEINEKLELSKQQQKKKENHISTFTSEIVLPTSSFSAPEFPTDLNLSLYIPVFITAAISPSLFWFKLLPTNVVQRFGELEDDIQAFYHSSAADLFKMCHTDINIGSTCVAFHEDYWYRVTVTSSPIEGLVNVFFVDYGGWEKVHCSNLRYLKHSFHTLPAQAFKAQLALVKPAKEAKTWSKKAEARFLQLCIKDSIMAQIRLEFNDFVSVLLCDTSGNNDIHVSDTLVDEGLADYCAEDFLPVEISDISETGDSVSMKSEEQCHHSSKISLPQRLFLGEGYHIYLIFIARQIFVSAGDMSYLFWTDKPTEALIEKLGFKDVKIPVKIISKDENPDLFEKCENLSINGFKKDCSQYSVTLYPLNQAIKILNSIGHPSITVRETINQVLEVSGCELKEEAVIEMCRKFKSDYKCSERNRCVFDTYSIYDLKALSKAIECKRITLQEDCNKENFDNITKELKKLENMSNKIEERIKYLNLICSTNS